MKGDRGAVGRDAGHYYGVERDRAMYDAGRTYEVALNGLQVPLIGLPPPSKRESIECARFAFIFKIAKSVSLRLMFSLRRKIRAKTSILILGGRSNVQFSFSFSPLSDE